MTITSYGEGIFTIANYLSPSECAHYIAMGEHMGYEESEVSLHSGSRIMKEIRNNQRVIFDDPNMAAHLFERARTTLPAEILGWRLQGFNERMRFYRYGPSEYFRWHKDGSYRRNIEEESMLTFMIYLNDDFDGGNTAFKALTIAPQQGMALVFPHRILHQGNEIRAGTKYVLRTDVMYRLRDGWALGEAGNTAPSQA